MSVTDPLPLAALLRAACEAHCQRTGTSMADIARASGMHPQALCRAIRDGADPRAQTVRPLLRVLGLRVVLVPA